MKSPDDDGLRITLLSLHGLIRGHDCELGRDADTGGQIKYVLELAQELSTRDNVASVELVTRQLFDDRVGPDYAQVEEPLSDKAKIIRIPFGPRRYLRKEALWPYLETFIDQMLGHYRRTGLPDLIHGHYADAGYAGAQLARLLHVPYVFTGHSLGRVKRERMLASIAKSKSKKTPEDLEKKFKFKFREEAEETALETAAMVITSTGQEVEQQYSVYHHYQPDRMEVIPPGVDLTNFYPDDPNDPLPPIYDQLLPFLREPDKPMIVAMARPDERKNLEMLVRVYGENPKMQDQANLVLVMGGRDDLRDLPPSQRKVITNVLQLIDVYDLYGKVAYPKSHRPADVPDLYRLTARRQGVFVNPAMTEPFGLTLLEAAASGVPIVATNDGGPRDIIANCQNGLLIDPFDRESIDHAIMRCLSEPEQWQEWSQAGITGTREHYSWKNHVDRYLRDVSEIIGTSAPPVLSQSPSRTNKRLPEFDRIIMTDLDNTMTGDEDALRDFIDLMKNAGKDVGFGIDTGRSLAEAMHLIDELGLPRPDVLSAAVGTELYYGSGLTQDQSWHQQISHHWDGQRVHEVLDGIPGLYLQKDKDQTEFKISYRIDPEVISSVDDVRRQMREAGLKVKAILSLGSFLDIIPIRGGSELSLRHLAYRWGFEPEHMLVAGDCGNDEGMLKGATLGVVVGNYSPELEHLRGLPRIYFAQGHHARGVLEGIEYYDFLNHIRIPNDRAEAESSKEDTNESRDSQHSDASATH
ncbi:HAD family hydrolase [Allorhodopirellula heiligendammensis]|uniref:sucrose-phosphate synthase n=1 Tax=Allorhodopirellula heiligendammensis TaxID=2714739 RepID=A0A5C6C1T0_9BACT|nr:HAD family hydrolase [Allorhodopirellula heiligendammensis]TWU18112.1 Mannosylfructose-phosphate synthase [Allorhodopirellula heiligendammensis]